MNNHKKILVDSSVWINFFSIKRGNDAISLHLDQLLEDPDLVVTCEPVYTEVLSGANTVAEFNRIDHFFSLMTCLSAPASIWKNIAKARFELAKKGKHATIIDLWLVLAAYHHQVPFWSLDKDFIQIASVIPFQQYSP